MSDEPDNVVLVYLRRFAVDLARLTEVVDSLSYRFTGLERQVGQLMANEQGHYATVMERLDTVDRRLSKLERHADLVPAP